MAGEYWADKLADKTLKAAGKKEVALCSAGITPSGVVHIGNFRDILTSDAVYKALKEKKANSKLIFFWDDFDRLRKIPVGVPTEFEKYLGMPISKVPDPYKCHKSYAEHFKADFQEALPVLGISPEFINQSHEYEKNRYFKEIKTALQKRKKIAEILSEFKTQGMKKEEIETYYPLQIYCRKCGKDSTKITDYDEENKVTYSCQCGHKETADISKENIGKLTWKIDWPMRWVHYGVKFEPGGIDHATPGGSFDVAKKIATEIFNIKPPILQGYAFVSMRGENIKMSSSKGNAISPKDLLEIYEPELLKWLFTRTHPENRITFCFDTELIRQYDEFDKEVSEYNNLSDDRKKSLELAKAKPNQKFPETNIPFKQVASFGQVAQGNFSELKKMFIRINQNFDENSLKQRLEKSQNWIKNYATQFEIKVREKPNKDYYQKLNNEEKSQIDKLREELQKNKDLESLTALVYAIPKKPGMSEDEKKERQRNFFKNVYQMLIDNDTGPRLPTFLLALGEEKVRKLLKI